MFQLGSRSDVTSSPTQIPLWAVVKIEITCSNACRNARILSIEIIFSLMKSGKLVDLVKSKKKWGGGGLVALEIRFDRTFDVTLRDNSIYGKFTNSCN